MSEPMAIFDYCTNYMNHIVTNDRYKLSVTRFRRAKNPESELIFTF